MAETTNFNLIITHVIKVNFQGDEQLIGCTTPSDADTMIDDIKARYTAIGKLPRDSMIVELTLWEKVPNTETKFKIKKELVFKLRNPLYGSYKSWQWEDKRSYDLKF